MISTYAELQTAVGEWSHRTDLTAKIPDFIQMGENVLNRRLRTVDMESIATLTADPLTRFLALPTGAVDVSSLWIESPREEIIYKDPVTLSGRIQSISGQPKYFTLKSNIEFDRIPSTAYSIECRYFKKYDLAADVTNTLLIDHPELYLHAALAAASLYAVDDARLATFKSLLEQEINELNTSAERKRGSHLATLDTELVNSGFDIIRGE